jgi:hypothetical protein
MDSLPQVLYDQIASFIQPSDLSGDFDNEWSQQCCLPQLATISRKWQMAIEPITFRSLNSVTSDELDEFQKIVGQSNRQQYLRSLSYTIHLNSASSFRPNTSFDHNSGGYVKKNESIEEQNCNNQSFSDAIRKLFTILKSWEDESVGIGNLHLCIGEALARDQISPPTVSYEWVNAQNESIPRFTKSYLQIVDLDKIHPVQGVTSLAIQRSQRELYWTVAVDFLSKLPTITAIDIELNDDNTRDPDIRRQRRHDFGLALDAKSFPSLRTVRLQLLNDSARKQISRPANLMTKSVPAIDPVSLGVRNFSQNLAKLEFNATIDSSLFWSDSLSSSSENLWPQLEELIVTFYLETPSGGWYFKSPNEPDEDDRVSDVTAAEDGDANSDMNGDTDSDLFTSDEPDESEFQEQDLEDPSWMNFRTDPTKKVEELLESFARACITMPKLRLASLTTTIEKNTVEDSAKWEWGVDYVAPGKKYFIDAKDGIDSDNRRLYWQIKNWRPTARAWECCRKIGSDQHRVRMDEVFLDIWD